MAEAAGAGRPGDRSNERSLEAWRERTNGQPLYRALGVVADDLGEGFTQLRVRRIEATAAADAVEAVDTFAISTAVDLALVSAVSTTIRRGAEVMNGTAELNITYARKAQGGAIVRATVAHRDAFLAIVEIEVTDETGALVGRGRGSYAVRQTADAPTGGAR